MKSKIVITAILSGVLLFPVFSVQAGNQEQVYGWQLMTDEERTEHMSTMQGLKTPEEREAYQMQHQARMQQRAQEQDITLPLAPTGAGSVDAPQEMDDAGADRTGSKY